MEDWIVNGRNLVKGIVFAVAAYVVLGIVVRAEAAPAKGYLSAQEILNLFDQYSRDSTPLQEIREAMGSPGRMISVRVDEYFGGGFADLIFWTFEDYGTTLVFPYDKENNAVRRLSILQHYESRTQRDKAYKKMRNEFIRILGEPPPYGDDEDSRAWSLPQGVFMAYKDDKSPRTRIAPFMGTAIIEIFLAP
jgi:hypothetical protein